MGRKLQKLWLRREPGGEIITVWGRVCWQCRIWFATPYRDDNWVCPSCGDKKRAKKVWPTARVVREVKR